MPPKGTNGKKKVVPRMGQKWMMRSCPKDGTKMDDEKGERGCPKDGTKMDDEKGKCILVCKKRSSKLSHKNKAGAKVQNIFYMCKKIDRFLQTT